MNAINGNHWPLTLSWLIPAFTALVILLVPKALSTSIKWISLLSASLSLILSIVLTTVVLTKQTLFDSGSYLFNAKISWFPALNIYYQTGVDSVSVLLGLLAAIILWAGVLVSWKQEHRSKEFFTLIFILASGVFGCFITLDLFTFFLFNEITLIPTYLLIGIFGSGNKEKAAMKLNLMLFLASAFILTGFLGLYAATGSFDSNYLSSITLPFELQYWIFPVLFLGFGVLGALFPLHTWSPDGHSSAPTAVSMFLAGIHMKLGGYGCLRFAIQMLPEGAAVWADSFAVLAVLGIVAGAWVALKQKDLKYINAYSSVSHCGLVLFGFCSLNAAGLAGGVFQMLAHGLLTALIFALIGIVYARTHTRNIDQLHGLMHSIPFVGVTFTLAGLAALGLPGFGGFVAELTVLFAAWQRHYLLSTILAILALSAIVVTSVYILRMLHQVFSGEKSSHPGILDATLREKIPILGLIGLLLVLGFYPKPVMDAIHHAISPIVKALER